MDAGPSQSQQGRGGMGRGLSAGDSVFLRSHSSVAVVMGCRLSRPWMGDRTGVHGRDLTHLQKREAFRILASYEQPITLQIEGRGRSLQYNRTTDCSTQTERPWDPLRLNLCTLPRLPPSDRAYYDHMSLPGTRRDGGRCEYLPNTARDPEHRERLAYTLSSGTSPGENCLIGCCNTNLDEPRGFQSQTDDDDYTMERPLGHLPLHHELDSGLGWTDGSFHQGELSGVETEEGLEECHGGSPSSESFFSSELSDSGFHSVSTGEFLRFQRLLEKRMRHYNARMHHQGEPCSHERCDSQIKHPLEAIPETLTVQPQHVCAPVPGSRGLSRVSSVQYHKAERPCLNRHSSSSGSLFNPGPHPISEGMLRRSRTLHHRSAPAEYRRRASHPASPNYCSATLHPCVHRDDPPMNLPQEQDLALMHTVSHTVVHPAALPSHTLHAMSQPSLITPVYEHCCMPPDLHTNGRIRASTEPQLQRTQQTPNNRFHTLSHTPSQDSNETWPKLPNRAVSVGGGGLYSTLEGHAPARKPPGGNLRALRNQMLRERASRLADERSGMSTDEESHSEVRMGRYWSRSERREHMLQKQRQARNNDSCSVATSGLVHSGGVVGGANRESCSTVLELSQKKLSRMRNRKLLDDWTTVEELLTHGSRLGPSEAPRQLPTSLLTVTTV
ncbi:E3 ubiquitin-protein ligase PDZRN3 [Carassius gibelio]|uniref:E3 ubiquitin-protein ligase PDZRN3 n=1 Tax=Carassius gibelio TaxID=101364 RepID=UPI00227895D8|nr:E3 ubiquitin-protein ligase PDZRN3 [Carassius gibelio]XP_052445957.1 E3 ubiquitin-protein ligase PDZRN3 [Carassius gibelio]